MPLIVTATKAKNFEEFQARPLAKSLEKLNIPFYIEYECKKGLPATYNPHIRLENDVVICVHDDVEIEDLWLLDKINNTDADVVVCAGAISFDKSSPVLAWHLACQEKNHMRGEVAHYFPTTKQVATNRFGPSGRVVTFDGVFMAIKPKNLVEKGVLFDEQFKWHFYDIDFSLNVFKNGLKAVIPDRPIRIVHHGLGDSMNTSEFQKMQIAFKKKHIP